MEMLSKEKSLSVVYNNLVDMMLFQQKTHVSIIQGIQADTKGSENDQVVANFFKPASRRTRIPFFSFQDIQKRNTFGSRLTYCSIFSSIDEEDDPDRRDDLQNDTVILFIEGRENKDKETQAMISLMTQYEWKKIYVITPVELTPSKKKTIENAIMAGSSIIPYIDYQLGISVLKHAFSPIAIKTYKAKNVRIFATEENIEPSKIPLIKRSDPLSRALGLSKGDILIETIPGTTTTENDVVYRKVVL